MSTPLVSVLLPVRNAAATLPRCLDSLARQTLRDYEVVAVDDGSTDDSRAILESWASRDRRVRVTRTPARGLVDALNLAFGLAEAPLLARMDADDVCTHDRLATQRRRFLESSVDVLGSGVAWRGGGDSADGMRAYVDWQNALGDHDAIVRDLLVESPLVHPSVMMSARVLRQLSGYRDFDGPEDYDLWLRAERAGFRFGKCPEVLLEWWDGSRRLTRVSSRYAPEAFLSLKTDALLERHLPAERPVVIWGAGPVGKSWSRALQERERAVAAFVEVDPRKLGMRIHGVPTVHVTQVPSLPAGALHLAAVGRRSGRDAIRAEAARHGLRDGRDLVAVA